MNGVIVVQKYLFFLYSWHSLKHSQVFTRSLQLALFTTLTGICPFSTAGTLYNTHRYLSVLYSWHTYNTHRYLPVSTARTLYNTYRYLPVLYSWRSSQHSQVFTRSLQLALFTTLTGIYQFSAAGALYNTHSFYPFSTAGTLYNTQRYLPVLCSWRSLQHSQVSTRTIQLTLYTTLTGI